METPHIKTQRDGDFLHITLARPEKRNALTLDMMERLARAFEEADGETGLRAIIVDAEGPVFSSGIDVMALAQARAGAGGQETGRWLRRWAERLQQCLHIIEQTELPVIGALQGRVLGLGLELALSFDLRVATEDCRLAMPETRLGLIPDVGGTTRLTKLLGPARAKDMIMTARALDAREALDWGLVNRVAPPGAEVDAARALAGEIGANAPLAVGMAKLLIDQGDGLERHAQMAMERWAQSQLVQTEDMTEAMAAFMEKRPPQFKGK